MDEPTPAYVRDFVVEQLRDFVRDELDADFDDVVIVEPGAASFVFISPDGGSFRVSVERVP